jgi:hypothetical protein
MMRIALATDGELYVVFTKEDVAMAREYLHYLVDMGYITHESMDKCLNHLTHGTLPDNVVPFPDGGGGLH